MKIKHVIVCVVASGLAIGSMLYSVAAESAMVMSRPMTMVRPSIRPSAPVIRPSTPTIRPSTPNTMMSAAVIMMLMSHPSASSVVDESEINRCREMENPEDDEQCVQMAETIANQ